MVTGFVGLCVPFSSFIYSNKVHHPNRKMHSSFLWACRQFKIGSPEMRVYSRNRKSPVEPINPNLLADARCPHALEYCTYWQTLATQNSWRNSRNECRWDLVCERYHLLVYGTEHTSSNFRSKSRSEVSVGESR